MEFTLVLSESDAEHIDGLCTSCWTSALWRVYFDSLTDSGVDPRAAFWTGCVECASPGEIRNP